MVVARILLAVAMAAAGYLTWVALKNGAVAGWGQTSDCEDVLRSKWSHWLGLPVNALALAVYAALLAGTFAIDTTRQRRAWQWVIVLAVAVAGAALWFVGLQVFVLNSYCK